DGGDVDPAAPPALREPGDLARWAACLGDVRLARLGEGLAQARAPAPVGEALDAGVGDEAGDWASDGRHPPGTLPERLPQLRGGALGWEDVELDAGRHLEAGADRDSRRKVEVPVELLGSPRRADRPGVELRNPAEARLQGPQRGAQHADPDLAVRLEARRRTAGDDPQL